jgi:hypothetical protein
MPTEPLDLFATPEPEPRPVGALDLTASRQRFAALAAQRVYIGTSSWKYPGWCGMIYDERC